MKCFFRSGLEEVVFPAGVRGVGAGAFKQCRRLRCVLLNEGLEKLGEEEPIDGSACRGEAFRDTAIESIRLPSTLKTVMAETFEDCKIL